jgi:hypothetical protein
MDKNDFHFVKDGINITQKNSETTFCIINVSGNNKDFGIVKNANSELFKIFGYKPKELINENINMLMCEFYASIHESLMLNFF